MAADPAGLTELSGPHALAVVLGHLAEPCVSLYLPTHRFGEAAQLDARRLRVLIDEADAALEEIDLAADDRARLLAPGIGLVEDPEFWRHQDDALVLFLTATRAWMLRLPESIPELAVVGEHPYLHPIVDALADARRVLILALSEHSVRLFDADRWSITELAVPDLPENVDALTSDRGPQAVMQMHRSGAGPTTASFVHGHGGRKDADDRDRQRYLREVERALQSVLATRDDPLVLAATDDLAADFRAVTAYAPLLEVVSGAPDRLDAADLGTRAWPLLEPARRARQQSACDTVQQMRPSGRVVDDPEGITELATSGRVSLLLVPPVTALGSADPTLLTLLDDAVVATLRHRGDVVVVDEDHECGPLPAALRRIP